MTMQITATQKARTEAVWSGYAGENVTIECTEITAPIYAYGSELAVLRLFAKMGCGRFAYSENLGSWFYANK